MCVCMPVYMCVYICGKISYTRDTQASVLNKSYFIIFTQDKNFSVEVVVRN